MTYNRERQFNRQIQTKSAGSKNFICATRQEKLSWRDPIRIIDKWSPPDHFSESSRISDFVCSFINSLHHRIVPPSNHLYVENRERSLNPTWTLQPSTFPYKEESWNSVFKLALQESKARFNLTFIHRWCPWLQDSIAWSPHHHGETSRVEDPPVPSHWTQADLMTTVPPSLHVFKNLNLCSRKVTGSIARNLGFHIFRNPVSLQLLAQFWRPHQNILFYYLKTMNPTSAGMKQILTL
jgi:hypothetical protein